MPKLIVAFFVVLLVAAPTIAQRREASGRATSSGLRFVVQGKTEAVADIVVAEMEAVMRPELRSRHIDVDDLSTIDGQVSFRVTDLAQMDAGVEIARQQSAIAASSGKFANLFGGENWDVRVIGPNRVAMRPTKLLLDVATESAMTSVRDVIARRLIALGARVGEAKRIDARNILVEIRGFADVRRVEAVITRPARLRLSPVDLTALPERVSSGRAPVGSQILVDVRGERVAVARRDLVTNRHVTGAYDNFDKLSGQAIIEVNFDDVGTRRLANFTSENIGRSFAIILDDVILASPIINRTISNGSVRISGSFSREEAADMALALVSGPLPIDVKIVEESVSKR